MSTNHIDEDDDAKFRYLSSVLSDTDLCALRNSGPRTVAIIRECYGPFRQSFFLDEQRRTALRPEYI